METSQEQPAARPSGEHSDPRPPPSVVTGDDAQQTWRALQWAVDVLADLFETERSSTEAEPVDDVARYGLDAGADTDAYRAWLLDIEHTLGAPDPEPSASPLVSLFVALPGAQPDVQGLAHCVASVLAQVHPAWELFLCHDASCAAAPRAEIDRIATVDRRVDVVGGDSVADACAAAEARAGGELVAVVDPDGELTPDALETLARWALADPGADVVYSDEDELDDLGRPAHPRFKPDWSPDLLLSSPYLGHMVAVRRTLLDEIGGLWTATGGHYDLMLRATERARAVAHIPRVLYRCARQLLAADDAAGQPGASAGPGTESEDRRALTDALGRRGIDASVEPGLVPGSFRTRRAVRGEPTVSVIIPFRDQGPMLRSCVDSLHGGDPHARMEIVLVDNGSVEPETLAVSDLLCRRPGVG
ncbi:MAG: glycosyltransferase, partial [Acidimicrobiales bacterium]